MATLTRYILFLLFLPYIIYAKRCCSPDLWQAELVETEGRFNGNFTGQMHYKLLYDWPSRRWAMVRFMDGDKRNKHYMRLVFNHEESFKYLITKDKCIESENYATMQQYCVLGNATVLEDSYYGSSDDPQLHYQSWYYDLVVFPRRTIIKVSKKKCYPIQEGSYALVRNTWEWSQGQAACIPWQDPDRVRDNTCYQSFYKVNKRKGGTQAGGHMLNARFMNFHRKLSNEEVFKIPENCTYKEQWPKKYKLDDMISHFIMRFKRL